jgi:hypothetical protein
MLNATSEVFFCDSLLRKMRGSFVWLFIVSIPLWWSFEYLNLVVQNWHYLYLPISQLHYILQSSVDFSIVVPAMLSTTFFFQRLLQRRIGGRKYRPFVINSNYLILSVLCGVIFLCLTLSFPHEMFPLIWIAPFLILDPINYVSGFPSLLRNIERGRWLIPLSVMIATLFNGFWWEMWNFYTFPKWFYTIPYVGFWKIFEMPLLGYGGYLFFGLIVWSYAALVLSISRNTVSKGLFDEQTG